MNLEEKFFRYKNITLSIIETVKSEEYEKLDELFTQRQLILDCINKFNYSKEELKKLYLQNDIENSEIVLSLEMKIRKDVLQKKIKQNEIKEAGMRGYNNISTKAVYLSKEV